MRHPDPSLCPYRCPACGPTHDVLHGDDVRWHCLECDAPVAALTGAEVETEEASWKEAQHARYVAGRRRLLAERARQAEAGQGRGLTHHERRQLLMDEAGAAG